MQRKRLLLAGLSIVFILVLLSGCASAPKPSAANFKNPTVALSHVEIPYYVGYYYFANSVAPTQGKAGDYGAPLQLAFIYDIHNPNEYPVQLNSFRFTVMFEDFEVNTVSSPEIMWVPAGKTNQLRVPAMFDTRQTLLTLLLPGAPQLQKKGVTPWELLEKWWVGAPDFSFDVSAAQGAAVFSAAPITRVVAFDATFP
jgi:hypothetical protein